MWNNLLDEDPIIQSRIAQGIERGIEKAVEKATEKAAKKAEAEGALNASRQLLLELVEARFPQLMSFAEQRVMKMKKTESLRRLVGQIAVAPDEAAARRALDSQET